MRRPSGTRAGIIASMTCDQQKTCAPGESARSLWLDIASCLEEQKKRLYEEIKCYPTPIAACDQQFNYLLEQQANISKNLACLQVELKKTAPDKDSLGVLMDVIESACIDNAIKERFRSRLQ
jgi:hypothetical protein